jgi:hypothetical protein
MLYAEKARREHSVFGLRIPLLMRSQTTFVFRSPFLGCVEKTFSEGRRLEDAAKLYFDLGISEWRHCS